MVTVAEVKDAQRAWGKGIIAIATAHANGGDYVGLATDHVNTLYAYQMGPVLFFWITKFWISKILMIFTIT